MRSAKARFFSGVFFLIILSAYSYAVSPFDSDGRFAIRLSGATAFLGLEIRF